uniref:Plasmalemma vesicle associated protein n=1 Tax=Capra hircus TaxID=9925 RepID=A0A8C2P1E4_CAPHI
MGLAMEHGSPYSRAGSSSRGCWYYLRYFFLFVSLIQFLIILGLVLFMVYGNVHVSTESNLQATERRADGLYGQVVGLTASQANLSKELNLTARARDAINQMMLNARRDLDRINASFRQCQADRVIYINNQRYMAAIILSEKQCQEHLKEANRSCDALALSLTQKAKTLEVELAKEKLVCTKDKDGLTVGKRVAEEQLAECSKARDQQQQERQLAEDRLRKVQAFCLSLDKNKFEMDVRNLWRDSIIPRTLGTLGFNLYHPLGSELPAIQRACDSLPSIMTSKVEELARSLRAGIDSVTLENEKLQRQKLEVEQSLRASQEAKEKVALQKERDRLVKELEEKKREAEHLKLQLAVKSSALETCITAKSQLTIPGPRPAVPAHNPPPIDPASLEEFKRRILDSQRAPASNVLVSASG